MTGRFDKKWTAEEEAKVTRLYPLMTRREIAAQMGLTYGQVCGKCRGLKLRREWGSQELGKPQKNGTRAYQKVRSAARMAQIRAINEIIPVPDEVPPPQVVKRVVSCCWVLDTKPTRYCDQPSVPGSSWCPQHYKIAVYVPKPRAEKRFFRRVLLAAG